jgi:hypothetical protein
LLKGAGFETLPRIRNVIRMSNCTEQFPTFTTILATQAISIGRIWRGPHMRQAAVFQSNRLETRSSMPRSLQKRRACQAARLRRKDSHQSPYCRQGEGLIRHSRGFRYGRRGQRIAARPRKCLPFPLRRAQCGAPAAEPASAPALRAASLCHARTVSRRRIPEISRNPSDLGEGVAPQKWRGGSAGNQARPCLRQAGAERS